MSDQLILQFSTAAEDWYSWTPQRLRRVPFHILFDRNVASIWIRRLNHSPFSHVDMMMDDGNMLGASDNPNAPVVETVPKGNPRGVAIRPQGYQQFAYRRRMVLETNRAYDIRSIARTQLGKNFDNSGLKDFLSDKFPGQRDWRLDDHWFCAELVMWALDVGGFWQPERMVWPRNRVSPTDVLVTLLMDPRWVNRETFWSPVHGLALSPGET